jgi:hypothetical protein
MRYFVYTLLAICAVTLLSSCEHDEPVNPIKPLEDRTVLLVTSSGEIYDQNGDLVQQLPNCTFASEIIADGDDYFVAGVQSKGRVGYWKNGKWNTLHVDFIDDVDHWTYGIGKWDYYIYLLDIPNVLKNSGIFPLEDCQRFIPADHGLRVTEGTCYVIGYEETDEEAHYAPVLYSNRSKNTYKKEYLPMPPGAMTGECKAIYAYDRDHTVIGGIIDRRPAIWVDKQYTIYDISCPELLEEGTYPVGRIEAITMCNGHIYAAGFEYNEKQELTATVWTDGIPTHYQAQESDESSSQAIEIYSYGGDVYLLTREYSPENGHLMTYLWLNGHIIMSYTDIEASGFTVL